MKKVIVEILGGAVIRVRGNMEAQNLQVLIMDRDVEGADPDEIMSKEEVLQFCGSDTFKSIYFKSGFYTEDEVQNE